MTPRQFFDWQTNGGADDVIRLVSILEKAGISWCTIGGIAVNHWASEPMVTRDVDIVIATQYIERARAILSEAEFTEETHRWSVNLKGHSDVSIQMTTDDFYKDFPARSVPADVHGVLLRVASLEDTLKGKIRAWRDSDRRRSKRIKDLADISRLLDSHPKLEDMLDSDVREALEKA